ncbi:MAG: alanine--tRNA ligase [Lactobacillus sp.]|jgi:alanyl-tRNA synthetase|uniref:Alanine--tRNA ligase n=1 Tax=Lacticaseibacillus suilingensis TaxID=2799577 RepID=A0ABW4BGX8_9LACO|nr:alanine--tRNA ligase [Lacticaseibacillus suilingensis]MCI1893736.1 alanine--tRNA ligase [Lactobacillus sp.]MCI1916714.1 alanine--tRNA ligase [Lactobacillus sp.]MCI1941371.1 alanine--tRNA ligase [Lactobacillus sp.]MCI1971916.1 alanine--tRNA ligase [Lactobacillus sp.]MCI2016577.1 alanine--tRNA ligase [Lactobacillus sp.]
MKQLSSGEIRQMFLDFFKSKGHAIEPSASLIPVDDPTLLWINSGVATLKKYFDGTVVPKNPRITNAQKSIRTNDIENVGKTARHLTFFEMLGNFSVGDYFKKEVIPWAWEFLTSDQWLGLDKDKLYVTVYPKDQDAKAIWEQTGVPASHIFEVEDNFWDIGEGPSGPDTEIFYDRGQSFSDLPEDDPENYPGGENERYEEIWNIVFSQYNHLPDGRYVDQPHKNIDTGMGLERLVSVIQGTKTNFETDLFMPIIKATEKMSAGHVYGEDKQADVAFKIIADHARTVTFAIGDGALPSNEGRGYVLRRLIRRAAVNGSRLGIQGAFLYKLVPVVGEIMASYYPEINRNQDFIEKVIHSEEDRFQETLNAGMALLSQTITELKAKGETEIPGATAFKLFDTFGFPVELTKEIAGDQGVDVDMKGYEQNMQAQRERARAARGDAQSMGSQDKTLMAIKTPSKFTGWTDLADQATLMDLLQDDTEKERVEAGTAQLIFDQTPFYAEMGGQVADHGTILDDNGTVVAKVVDVQHAPNGQNLHTVEVENTLKKGATYTLQVDTDRRRKVSMNHTATHLLDQALRQVLGEHTHQAGSLVEPTYLRFDFTNFGQVTPEQLRQVEQVVNEQIWRQLPITWREMPIEEAKKQGAIAMFGDKYGDTVRVVTIGDFNREFDGGTHPTNTAALGLFKITGESGIGAGIRRIEAVTSQEAYEYLTQQQDELAQAANTLKIDQVANVPAKVEQLQAELKASQKTVEGLQAKLAAQEAAGIFDHSEQAGAHTLIAKAVKVAGMNELRQLADQWRTKQASDVLVLATANDGKVSLLVAASEAANQAGIKAGALIKAIAPAIGGGGGGRPDLAQAGGKNPAGIADALAQAKQVLAQA